MNVFKTFLFLTLLAAIFLVAGFLLGGKTGLIIAFGVALVMNFVSYWFSDKIVLMMYRAKPLAPEDAPLLFEIIGRLTAKAGMPMPKVYILPSKVPNAFATGRNPSHAAVAVTEGILDLLEYDEVEGVIAHELAHVKNRDILIATIAATMAAAIGMLAHMAQWGMIFSGGRDRENRNPLALVAVILMMILAPLAAMLVQMAISRSREFGADESGARLAGNADGLKNALLKLEGAAVRTRLDANPATAHMFIVNPLRGKDVLSLFSTHPPIERRVAKLEALVIVPEGDAEIK